MKSRLSAGGKGKNGRKHASKNREVSATATQYRGPILLPKSLEQDRPVAMNFSYTAALNASVGGVVDYVNGSGLALSAGDWASLAAVWHEYRVLGFEFNYQPLATYTSSYPPLIVVMDRNNSATLGSYATAANHESAVLLPSRYPWKKLIKMSGIEESVWTPVATTLSTMYIKLYGDSFATSQNLGRYLMTFLVQFRGRA